MSLLLFLPFLTLCLSFLPCTAGGGVLFLGGAFSVRSRSFSPSPAARFLVNDNVRSLLVPTPRDFPAAAYGVWRSHLRKAGEYPKRIWAGFAEVWSSGSSQKSEPAGHDQPTSLSWEVGLRHRSFQVILPWRWRNSRTRASLRHLPKSQSVPGLGRTTLVRTFVCAASFLEVHAEATITPRFKD